MQLRLNVWRAPGSDYTRIYLNGLPVAGKAWLQGGGRGAVAVHFEGGSKKMPDTEVIALVMAASGWDGTSFRDLVGIAEAMPAAPRGRQPGVMAANRRTTEAERPERWTGADAAALDPNAMTHPLETETTIVVDDREPAAMVDLLRLVHNLRVEIASLETGDYVLPERLVIERKTAHDLAESVVRDSKRLFWQTDRVASSGMHGVLLLEGDIYGQTNMSLASISGTLSYLSVIQGVSVVPTLSMEHSAYMVVKLIRHVVDGLGYDLALRGAGPKDPREAGPHVLEGVPGVSAAGARALIASFGSVQGVSNANLQELKGVPGIGPKRAKQIYETLRGESAT